MNTKSLNIILSDIEKTISADPDETVLDALLRSNVVIPYSCTKGTCLTCKLVAVSGEVSAESQKGLKETQKAQGVFLACQHKPTSEMVCKLPASSKAIEAKVTQHRKLNDSIVLVKLKPSETIELRPGQYINVQINVGSGHIVSRCYSIASMPGEDIELHVRKKSHGLVSKYIYDELSEGMSISISGPEGDSFYLEGPQTLLLAGTGTGFSPVLGIAKHAAELNHQARIILMEGASKDRPGYGQLLYNELPTNIAEKIEYYEVHEDLTTELVGWVKKLSGNELKVHLAGNPNFVQQAKKKLFLAGLSLTSILTDPFVEAGHSNS